MIFAQQQFAGAAHHAARFHAADIAQLQHIAAGGNDCAGPRQDHLDAGPRIGGAADDLQRVLAIADRAKPQLVGIGMPVGGDDFADHEILQRCARIGDAFHFQPNAGQLFADLGGIGIGIQMFFQPGEGEFHRLSPPSRVGMSSG